MGVVVWTLSESTLSSTTICLNLRTNTSIVLPVPVDSEPRVSPSLSSPPTQTPRSSTKCKNGLKSTSANCQTKSMLARTPNKLVLLLYSKNCSKSVIHSCFFFWVLNPPTYPPTQL